MDSIKKEKKVNTEWKKEIIGCFSSDSISIKPLLKKEVAYPFNLSALKSFNKNNKTSEDTKINTIQLFDKTPR
tara:strand:+ start:14786 stop:15004 length:219 start_codon:yes stop_codon:yes gene_type:complete